MKKLIIGFSKPKKFRLFAWLIMKSYGIPYDHVFLKFHSNTYDRDIIYQASKMMINFMGSEVFAKENIIVQEFEIEVSDENWSKLMQFSIDNAGKPYSLKEILGFTLVKICSWFGKEITNPFKEGTEEYVCSVLADYVLENYTNRDIPGDFENADPKYLHDYLISTNVKIIT